VAPLEKPRRHHHLSREAIVRTALDLVDREGIEALSIRRVADMLSVGPTNLYTYCQDRDSIVLGIVALLLSEVEPPDEPGLSWEDCVHTILGSIRAMALRHPRAFPLVAGAAYDEWPLVEYDQRFDQLVVDHGAPRDLYPRLASVLDAFVTGFLLLETQALVKPPAERRDFLGGPAAPAPQASFTVTHSDEAYEEGYLAIIAGFKLTHGLD
jgi:AcrR family transcriptional regulator